MKRIGFAVAAGLFSAACLCVASPQAAEQGQKFAYFQPTNIFHAGLRGTHTVSLTFDDGPNGYTPAVLDALRAYDIKATFFIVGKMARSHPDVLAQVAAEGHLLANHSASHPALSRKMYRNNPQALLDQLRNVNDVIAPLMAPNAKLFFRAPYGSWYSGHAAVLNADPVLKYYVGPIYWDVGGQTYIDDKGYVITSADWDCWHRHWKAETCAKGYLRDIERKDGGVVLMHCIHSQSAALVNAIVPTLIQQGYKFVRLDEIKEFDKYQTPPASTEPVVAMRAPTPTATPK